ncbi:MAG: phage tail tape measure protein [Sphingomonas hengshuiensis]|nr:MAG: phage tail tape measure protein [Sphingomonas hengshuiensis]
MIAAGPAEAIVEIFRRIKDLKPEEQMGALKNLMGLEYADDAARMAQSLDLIIQALDMINDPARSRGSVDRAFTIFDELTSSKLTKLGSQFKSLGANIGKWLTPAIGGAADAASSLLDRINAAFDRAAQVKAMADKTAKGEDLTPEEKAKLATDPSMKQDVTRAAAAQDHPVIGLVQQLIELEKELASVQGRAGKGDVMAQSQLANAQAQINQVRSEIEEAMKLPGAAEAVSQSMAAVAKAVGSEGEQAVQQAQQIAERIKALFNFTATPTISPRFGPAGGATFKDGTPVPTPPSRPPQKQGATGGARTFEQTNVFHINGAGSPEATGRAVGQQLARLGTSSGAFFDPVG